MFRSRVTAVICITVLLLSVSGASAQPTRKCSETCFQRSDRCFKDCDRTDPGGMLNCKKPCYQKVDRCYDSCMASPQDFLAPPQHRWR